MIAVISIVITFIGTIATVIGTIATVKEKNKPAIENSLNGTLMENQTSDYKIYLYPEYSKLKVNAETDIIAVLNFGTYDVTINAYLDSIKNGDTIKMKLKNTKNEWQSKIYFEEPGIFKVVATVTAPDGTKVEGFVNIEVVQ